MKRYLRTFGTGPGAILVLVSAVTASAGENTHSRSTDGARDVVTNSIGMRLVRIPAGEFRMGSPKTAPQARADEQPRHRVRLTRPFHMGMHEVTQAQYRKVMGENPSFFTQTGPGAKQVQEKETGRFPVEQVRWTDAVEFCRRLSQRPAEKQAGRHYRLPTEAEWEYACRAGTTTAFSFGESLSPRQANFNGRHPFGDAEPGPFLARTAEVGSYPSNDFGLYDMHGNVWEWCLDWYDADYYAESPRTNPVGPPSGTSRVIRGGGWYSDARDCRSAFRYAEIPEGVFYVMGFRVVMTTEPPSAKVRAVLESSAETEKPSKPDESARRVISSATLADLRAAGSEEWPRWRGPRGDGTWQAPELPDKWPEDLPRLWRQPVGGGYSGVTAAEGRVFTMDRRREPRELERVLCFHAATGERLWSYRYPAKYSAMRIQYDNGPRSTPTFHDGRLYTLGVTGRFHCLDAATGAVLWEKDFYAKPQAGGKGKPNRDAKPPAGPAAREDRPAGMQLFPTWGLAASPVIWKDRVIVHAVELAAPNGCLVALDRRTGKVLWRSVPDPAGYATPIVIEHNGREQLVAWTPTHVRGLDPHTGGELWSVPFEVKYGTSIATPIYHEGIALVSNYWEGAKAIRPGSPSAEAEVLWTDRRNLRALMAQPLCRDGYAYLLDKRHGLTCLELETGEKLWDDGNRMTPKGRNPQATMVWTGHGDRALVLNSEGELIRARLAPSGYHELARRKIIGPTWAHPAYAWGRVFARNDREIVCVSLFGREEPSAAGSGSQ